MINLRDYRPEEVKDLLKVLKDIAIKTKEEAQSKINSIEESGGAKNAYERALITKNETKIEELNYFINNFSKYIANIHSMYENPILKESANAALNDCQNDINNFIKENGIKITDNITKAEYYNAIHEVNEIDSTFAEFDNSYPSSEDGSLSSSDEERKTVSEAGIPAEQKNMLIRRHSIG